ncbi:mannitol dehydrogenase family protein [Corynebacterium sp. 335C]
MTELNRTTGNLPAAAPVRLVHLGLGAFHRAHQVWYTMNAEADPAHPEWGYASFSGRSATVPDELTAQEGAYTLLVRSADGDEPVLVPTISEAHPGGDEERLTELVADPAVAVVTLTITEAGYSDGPAIGRLVRALDARRAAGSGPIAVMSCDNLAGNGDTCRAAVLAAADDVSAELGEWVRANATFPTTSIDRITPRTDDDVVAAAEAATGLHDAAPVVTEPFASWIISGEFPAGRPDWEKAGAVFTDDIDPFENRKLWLLNGSHSLLAYLGQLHGHATIAEAIADEACRARVEEFWDAAARHLTEPAELDVPGYREALLERFGNPAIRHLLAQIAIDGATKLRMRSVPVTALERAAGRDARGAALPIAAWIAFLDGRDEVEDSRAAEVLEANAAADRVRALVAVLDDDLAADDGAVAMIGDLADELKQAAGR